MTAQTILFSSNAGDTLDPVIDTIVVNSLISGAGFTAGIQSTAPAVRHLPLTTVKTITGLPMITATAATTLPGIARSAGTSMYLTGLATVDTTPATTNMMWEFIMPDTYVPAANVPVTVNCVVPTATFVTAASTTMTVTAYKEVNGVETALTVSAAQQIPLTTAATLTFTVTGTTLVPGSRIVLQLVALVTTTAGGASSMRVNSVGFSA